MENQFSNYKMPNIVIISNILNHHMLPLCQSFIKYGCKLHFIETENMFQDRIDLGYKDMSLDNEFVIKSKSDQNNAIRVIQEADVIIIGGVYSNNLLYKFVLNSNKIIFRYSERLFKGSNSFFDFFKNIVRAVKYKTLLWDESKENSFLLCTGSNVSKDFKHLSLYKERHFRWGYFPKQDFEYKPKLVTNKIRILWVGRFIKLKRPIQALKVAYLLLKNNIDFELTLIGTGPEKERLEKYLTKHDLTNNVKILNSVPFSEVQSFMSKSDIFLFTSNNKEGWGAVLNESMGNGCIAISSIYPGSSYSLIKEGENGFLYKTQKQLNKKVLYVIDNIHNLDFLRKAAYETIQNKWDAELAVFRLLEFVIHNKVYKEDCFSKIV